MLQKTPLSVALAALLTALLAGSAVAEVVVRSGELTIMDAWARPTAPRQGNGAVYLTIVNGGDEADRLTAVTSPVAELVELHVHSIDAQGVARMREVSSIDLPGHGRAVLEPGGFHIMLLRLTEALVEGRRLPLTLSFEQADQVTIEATVGAAPGSSAAGQGRHGSGRSH
jgi:periplasmic copper chaperone A